MLRSPRSAISQSTAGCTPPTDRRRSGFSDETGLSHSAHRLEAAEDLLDPLSFALTNLVAPGAARPSIEPWCLASIDSSNMGFDLVLPHMLNEVLHVVALVGPQRLGGNPAPPSAGEQLASHFVFGHRRIGDEQIDAQTATVLHEHMAAIAEFGRLAVAFAHALRVGIGGALVGSIGALLALEIPHTSTVPAGLGRLVVVLALEALEGGPGVDQGTVHGEESSLPLRARRTTPSEKRRAMSVSTRHSRKRLKLN